MKHSIFYSAVTVATVISMAACNSDIDVAGIGGSGKIPAGSSGITSTGTITGFGSIFVNGIKFETGGSTFDVDDNPDSTEEDLAIGMRVTVNGSVNADGISGTATSVTYDDELQGPVGEVSAIDTDGVTRRITVLGIDVAVDSATTRFDDRNSAPGGFSFDNIKQGDNVEISGLFDSTGVLLATRIELKEKVFKINKSIVELKGTITGSNATDAFTLNLQGTAGVTVDIDASGKVHYDDLPAGLADSTFVEVKGTCPDLTCATIEATRIEGESEGFDDDDKDEVEIEGFITRYADDSDLDVDGLPVDASGAELEPASLVLTEDLRVEVEGIVVNNVLMAFKVKLED